MKDLLNPALDKRRRRFSKVSWVSGDLLGPDSSRHGAFELRRRGRVARQRLLA
jgi:hypothetical protein